MMRLLENQNQLLKKYTKNNFYKFLITGSLNTIFTYIIYLLLLIVIKYTYAYSISFVCGIVFSYIMNLKYVFSVSHSRKKILIYPLIYLFQYILSLMLLIFIVEVLRITQEIAPFIIVIVLIPLTYFLNKTIFTKL
jgi:putative flippase GtrA